jgi:hypothetical protein
MAAIQPFSAKQSFGKVAPHHVSIKALWEGKWRQPVRVLVINHILIEDKGEIRRS